VTLKTWFTQLFNILF